MKRTNVISVKNIIPGPTSSCESVFPVSRNNFIAVDVFFAQLKYIKIAQVEAFKLADFFGKLTYDILNMLKKLFYVLLR